MEAIIPIEIEMPTILIETPEEANVEAITQDLDIIDKLRETGTLSITSYQRRLENLHNRRVKPRTFKDGELVLRRVFESMVNLAEGKFQAN